MDDKNKQLKQELEYGFPYHYLPREINNKIVPGIVLDWASEYLLSLRLVREYIDLLKPMDVLDIGCGDGRLINDMSILFPLIGFSGIDYSSRAIELAKAMSRSTNVNFKVVDLNNENFDKTYDLVTSIEVLEHIPIEQMEYFFSRNINMVKKNGYFLIILPHKNKKLIDKHFQHFNSNELIKIVENIQRDLEIIEFRYLDSMSLWLEFMRKLAKNRIYTFSPLWSVILNKKLTHDRVSEHCCGRLLCLIKCK